MGIRGNEEMDKHAKIVTTTLLLGLEPFCEVGEIFSDELAKRQSVKWEGMFAWIYTDKGRIEALTAS